ncbi:GTP-binding protein Rhes [Eumeta japonica]|uniref:GTP-binding protein Rhes n=1 Tax=Eumeta variegata TaxID=151549 RepID=A0A4C1YYA0_EUMVA|nr:GTP-binding protein Rhes [Eumeta japonica]
MSALLAQHPKNIAIKVRLSSTVIRSSCSSRAELRYTLARYTFMTMTANILNRIKTVNNACDVAARRGEFLGDEGRPPRLCGGARARRYCGPTLRTERTEDTVSSSGNLASNAVRHKVVVLGAAKVGKSSIISQFLYGTFSPKYKRTVEEMHHGDFNVNGVRLTLDILDTSGAYEFPAMRALCMSSADAFVLVYDITDPNSFTEVRSLRDQIHEIKESTAVPIVVVGNKVDLAETGARQSVAIIVAAFAVVFRPVNEISAHPFPSPFPSLDTLFPSKRPATSIELRVSMGGALWGAEMRSVPKMMKRIREMTDASPIFTEASGLIRPRDLSEHSPAFVPLGARFPPPSFPSALRTSTYEKRNFV